MFKKIDKLVTGSFLQLFVLTFAVVLFILLMVFISKYFEDLVGKDLEVMVIAELFFYFAITLVPQALPLSVLLSSLMTFGNLGEHNELSAIKSSGIPLTRVLFPVGIFGILVSIAAFVFNNTIIPEINLKTYSLLYDIRQKNPALDFKEGAFYNGLPNWSIRIETKSKDGEKLTGLMIYDHSQNKGNTDLITAEKGIMKMIHNDQYLLLEVENGFKFSEQKNYDGRRTAKESFSRDKFDKARFVFPTNMGLNRTPQELFRSNRLMKNVSQLKQDADSMFIEAKKVRTDICTSSKNYFDFQFSLERKKIPLTDEDRKKINKTSFTIAFQEASKETKNMIYERAISKTENLQSMVASRSEQLYQYEKNARRELIEMHKKFTLSVACFIMFLIGAPLGAIIKKGGLGMPVIISIVFFITFYVMGISGDKMAREGAISVEIGTWMGNLILFGIGLFFLNQARKDSRILEADIYFVLWDKLKSKFVKKKSV